MTQAPDTQEKRADIELVRFWLPDEDVPEAHAALDRIQAALEKPVEKVDLELLKKQCEMNFANGERDRAKIRTVIDYLASRHPDLFGGKE